MNQHVQKLAAAARQLTPDEQAELLDELLIGLHADDESWNKAWTIEADHRWADYTAEPLQAIDAVDAIVDARQQLVQRRSK
jgi:putative addiction module component (TIGR02574 family)